MRMIFACVRENPVFSLGYFSLCGYGALFYVVYWPSLAIFGTIVLLVTLRVILGYWRGHRSINRRNGEPNRRTKWLVLDQGYCFTLGFAAGEAEYRRERERT